MTRGFTLVAATAIAATTLAPAPAQAGDHRNEAIAAVLLLGIAAAAARHGRDHDRISDRDEDRYGEPLSPTEGIVCLPRPRQCSTEEGEFSRRWTRRIFGH